jgi:hypothetical protein
MIFKILLLTGLIRLLIETEKPFLCSGLYAGGAFVIGLIFGVPLVPLVIGTALAFGLASLYFWLLNRFLGSGAVWWLILILGLAVGLV